jgi:carbohydrate esterase-like sialic acid-specific acetylesterase
MPSVLYEGMLAPIAPLSITGALWCQGEQNSDRGFQYRKILPVMIADWRKLFGQGDFPFYIVSLPAFRHRSETPTDDTWAETRESQALTAASVRNSCLAVTIDTGNPDNIHPKDKTPVGERLAFCALAKHYGKKVSYSGPTLASVKRLPGSIRLRFKLGRSSRRRQDSRCLITFGVEPERGPLCLAVESGGNAVQRCRVTSRSFQDGYLDGNDRGPPTILKYDVARA